MEHFVVPLDVTGIAAEFFESRDVVVDLWELHMAVFKLCSGPILFLGVLVLFRKFVQELIPYVWNVVVDQVKGI